MNININLSSDMVLSADGVPLSIMQYSHNDNRIRLITSKRAGSMVYLLFDLPKNNRCITLPLVYNDTVGGYEYLLSSSFSRNAGSVSMQVSEVTDDVVSLSNRIEGCFLVMQSIDCQGELPSGDLSLIDQLYGRINTLDTVSGTHANDIRLINTALSEQATALSTKVNNNKLSKKLLYSRWSSDSNINWGHPNGIGHRTSVTGRDFSPYETVRVHIEGNRSVFIDFNVNYKNYSLGFSIQSAMIIDEESLTFSSVGVELIYNKGTFRVNNIVSTGYNQSILSPISSYKVSRIEGLYI